MATPRWLAPFQELGVAAGLVYVLNRLAQRLSPKLGLQLYDLIEQPVSGASPLGAAHAQHVRFVELQAGAPELAQVPRPDTVKGARFEQGAVCLAVYLRDKYVGYAWLAFRQYDEDEVRCRFVLLNPERSAFDFDVFVFPAYRLGRAFAAVWHATNQYLQARGIERTCSRIAGSNVASHRAHSQLGARRIGRAVFVTAGRWQATASSALPFPWLHLGLQARPTLVL